MDRLTLLLLHRLPRTLRGVLPTRTVANPEPPVLERRLDRRRANSSGRSFARVANCEPNPRLVRIRTPRYPFRQAPNERRQRLRQLGAPPQPLDPRCGQPAGSQEFVKELSEISFGPSLVRTRGRLCRTRWTPARERMEIGTVARRSSSGCRKPHFESPRASRSHGARGRTGYGRKRGPWSAGTQVRGGNRRRTGAEFDGRRKSGRRST